MEVGTFPLLTYSRFIRKSHEEPTNNVEAELFMYSIRTHADMNQRSPSVSLCPPVGGGSPSCDGPPSVSPCASEEDS